ncbi:MAG: hypothetical protein RMJ19_09595 [Gemmatales bacterium]|nr:hypothetical protein [Gemmatales bacterium]MDW8175913.1 hypothetical protein [Gemmatales bacterium]
MSTVKTYRATIESTRLASSFRLLRGLCQALLASWRDCWYELFWVRTLWTVATLLAVTVCLSAQLSGPRVEKIEDELEIPESPGKLELLFGAVKITQFRDKSVTAAFLHSFLVRYALGPIGILLSLAGCSTLITGFLHSGMACLVLTSPANRWLTLLSRYISGILICALYAGLFTVATAFALAWSLECWPGIAFLSWGIYCCHLATFLGISILLGITGKHSALVLAGTTLFWLICQLVNLTFWQAGFQNVESFKLSGLTLAYWLLPKPADLTVLLDLASGAYQHFSLWPELEWAWETGRLVAWASLISSIGVGLAAVTLAGHEFRSMELL